LVTQSFAAFYVSGIAGTEKPSLSKTSGQRGKISHLGREMLPISLLSTPLRIKLGLMKNVVKVMDRDSQGFLYLQRKFPRISDEKSKKGYLLDHKLGS
jgi:hypothetical protein